MTAFIGRRKFITLLGGASVTGWPLAARAQQATPKTARIGWLKIQGPRDTPDKLQEFREGMRALGLVEGRDYVLEERYGDGREVSCRLSPQSYSAPASASSLPPAGARAIRHLPGAFRCL